jgi:hypothetical protein
LLIRNVRNLVRTQSRAIDTLSGGLTTPEMRQVSVLHRWRYWSLVRFDILGVVWTFDDLFENTGVHAEVDRDSFHAFIAYASDVFVCKVCCHANECGNGSNSCLRNVTIWLSWGGWINDATHCDGEMPAQVEAVSHESQDKHTARTYNLTVNHRRQIVSNNVRSPSSME